MTASITANFAAVRITGFTVTMVMTLALLACVAVPLYALEGSTKRDSVIFRNDPVVIVKGARISQAQFDKLKNVTAQIEILRGRATVPFGEDADGGVLRITLGDSAALVSAFEKGIMRGALGGGGVPSGMNGGGGTSPGPASGPGGSHGGGGYGGGGYGGGAGGAGGAGGSPTNYGPVPEALDVSGAAIYPIVIINGSRATDDSLYKIKPKMVATVTVMAADAAMAKYGKDATAGAIIITAIPTKAPAKEPKKKN